LVDLHISPSLVRLGKLTRILSCLIADQAQQFLSMGYLTINKAKSSASLRFASEMWIFLILTVILFLLTFAGWLCLDLPKERRWRHRTRAPIEAADEKV
jgi:heme/copper-type cytochrome/quinol oxidase subunit 3